MVRRIVQPDRWNELADDIWEVARIYDV